MIEIWKQIPGYEGSYEASSLGRIRSIDRVYPRKWRGKILKLNILNITGYMLVGLCVNGVRRSHSVHRLVALAFHGKCPVGFECGHLDNDRTNNVASNLLWVTKKENQQHRIAAGTANKGENAWQSKLSLKDVHNIRDARDNGRKTIDLAKEYGVHQTTISAAANKKNWKVDYPSAVPGLVA